MKPFLKVDFTLHYQSDYLYKGRTWKDRLDPIEKVTDMKMYIPWFMGCNPNRFPYWFGKSDPRNDVLYWLLQMFLKEIH